MAKRILSVILVLFPVVAYPAASGGTFTLEPDFSGYAVPYRPGVVFDPSQPDPDGSLASILPAASATVRASGTLGQTTTFAMDGGYARHSRVALDGAVVDLGGNPVVDLGLLPLEFCTSAAVYTGNLAPYGLNATSGLLDFRLPDLRRLFTRLSLSAGSFGLYSGLAQTSWNLGPGRMLAGVSYSQARNDYGFTAVDGSEQTASNLDYFRYGAILRYESPLLKFDLSHTGKRAGTGTYYAGEGRQADDMTVASIRGAARAFSYEASYVRWANEYSNRAGTVEDRNVNHALTLSALSVLRRNGGGTNASRSPFLNLKFTSRTYTAVSTVYGNPWDEQVSLSADGVLPEGAVDLGAAANLVYSASGGFQAMPSLSATVYLDRAFRLFASVSRSANFPSFNDLYWVYDGFAKGDPDLVPETGWKARGGVMLFALPFYGTVSAGYSLIDNLILWAPVNGVWTPGNVSRTTAVLAEAALHYDRLCGALRLRASVEFAYDLALNADPGSVYYGKRIIYSPLCKTSASVSFGRPDVWEAGVVFRQVGARFTTEANTVFLDPYCLLDVKVKWRFLFVTAANLLDADYEESQGYPMPGRNFQGGVDWQF